MSSPAQPAHLSNHQRNTLRQIFQHPAGHNIEWRAVLSLLAAVGSGEERNDGKVAVTIGSQTEYFDPPRHKDIDTQAVVNLRQMLTQAGYGADAADTRASADRPDPHSAIRLCITDPSLPGPGARRGTGTADQARNRGATPHRQKRTDRLCSLPESRSTLDELGARGRRGDLREPRR
jgi:hypothetical protein